MVRSAVKTAVTSAASYDSHTSPLGNLKAFLDEETEAKRSLESAKSSQIVCAKVGAEGPVLDSKSSPYYKNVTLVIVSPLGFRNYESINGECSGLKAQT